MFNLPDSIAAIATPPGSGGIAAVRISGNLSWEIIKKIFRRKDNYSLEHMQALYGHILDGDKKIDEVIILPFKSPRSFTAEDSIEIFCHGGNKIASLILDLCLKHGVRKAFPGEFTFRAFINGRIDLTEAEAVNEIINASNTRSIYAASEILSGSLKLKVKLFRENLLNVITLIESSIEFPLDVDPIQRNHAIHDLNKINNELGELIKNSESGQFLRDGIKVSIIGATNAGKSSLLNQLLENNRSIVTSEPGTTRDTVEEKFLLDGYPVVLTDTAGIRDLESFGEAEKLGIERSKSALENSDIALFIFDLTIKDDNNRNNILQVINGKTNLIVGNKIDLVGANGFTTHLKYDVAISARFGTNIDKLKELLLKKIKSMNGTNNFTGGEIHINQRQKELLIQCQSALNFATVACYNNEPEDLIADELKKAIAKLDEVSGRAINDDVISNIFSKFCIGK